MNNKEFFNGEVAWRKPEWNETWLQVGAKIVVYNGVKWCGPDVIVGIDRTKHPKPRPQVIHTKRGYELRGHQAEAMRVLSRSRGAVLEINGGMPSLPTDKPLKISMKA